MGFQSIQQQYRPPQEVINIAPFYGMSTETTPTEALVLGLTGRGNPGTVSLNFTLNAPWNSGLYMYYAYPVVYGLTKFLDKDSSFYGGWDGANEDPDNVWGPKVVNVTIEGKTIPFYVYRTDYPDLGVCPWEASPDN